MILNVIRFSLSRFQMEMSIYIDFYLYLNSIHHANSYEIIPGEGTRIER